MKKQISIIVAFLLLALGCKNKEQKTEELSRTPIALCTPIITDADWYKIENKAPLLEGLDVLNFPISTDNELAQKYFNQGLVLAYGFNHAEAARSFYYATKLDSTCAMAHWGFAYVLGPNYNAGMEPDNYERAYVAIQKAVGLAKNNVTPKEVALINALAKRYVKEPIDDRSDLDISYSKAMKLAFTNFPDDADIGTLYAESIMDLHPWDLYDEIGTPKEWTVKILKTLEEVIEVDAKHSGAHHFYIHAVESSKEPEKGLASAALFDEGLVSGAGHLVHMPSHIYIRTGDYHKGTLANIAAIKVDSNYFTACHAQGAYPLTYYPHKQHFMAATATLEGNSKLAIEAANMVADHANRQLMSESGWGTIQHYYTIPYYIYAKFGKWDEILAMQNEDTTLHYPEAVRHYARGMAYLGKDNLAAAKTELASLEKYATDESLKKITIWDINSVYTLIQIAQKVLKAEILASEEGYFESIKLLREAVAIEDELNYNEPPDWFFSVRHHLGAVQIEAGDLSDAVITLQDDLELLPKNGWALHGLKRAYVELNDENMEAKIDKQLSLAWATADIELTNARIK